MLNTNKIQTNSWRVLQNLFMFPGLFIIELKYKPESYFGSSQKVVYSEKLQEIKGSSWNSLSVEFCIKWCSTVSDMNTKFTAGSFKTFTREFQKFSQRKLFIRAIIASRVVREESNVRTSWRSMLTLQANEEENCLCFEFSFLCYAFRSQFAVLSKESVSGNNEQLRRMEISKDDETMKKNAFHLSSPQFSIHRKQNQRWHSSCIINCRFLLFGSSFNAQQNVAKKWKIFSSVEQNITFDG